MAAWNLPSAGARPALSLDHRIAIGATRIGVTRDEYRRHVEAGLKWCAGHHDWHPRNADTFYQRRTTPDGFDTNCKAIVRGRAREGMRRLSARRKAEREADASHA